MSDREFTGFDVDCVAGAVRQPPLDDLWAAARARRRRRSGAVTLAVVVALLGTAVLPLAAGTRRPEWSGPDEPTVRRDRATQLHLTGAESGVGVEQRGCSLRFAHTEDGGLSWSDYATARYRAATCRTDQAGQENAALDFVVLGQRSYLVRDGGALWLSTDHGRTWRDAEQAMARVAAFPPTARAVFCQEGCGVLPGPLAVDPSTGTVYRLAGEPPSPYPPFGVYPSVDGTIWAVHHPGGQGLPMVVARSVDRGATWNSWRPPAGAQVQAVVGLGEREAYLLIDPPPPAGAPPMAVSGPVQLLRTTDGGATWTDVGTDLPDTQETRGITVAPDGSLLVAESDHYSGENDPPPDFTSRLWVSRDEGRHFSPARAYRREDGAVGVAPGFAWLYGRDDRSALGADHVLLTADGRSWTRFPLPE
ncbi:WD40/YVTN/BNR-like repeat-containing protein [Micromonospora coxensis]|uniref:WD40/YVTN/BNR-like repeat-containing protein n=1 Tax=Micromonospora coxensis TaxID=356852 RepID=UPI003422A1CD